MAEVIDSLLARIGKTRADMKHGALGKMLRADGVPHSPELDRVLTLPARPEITDQQIEILSAALRQDPNGPARLFAPQCEALINLYQTERGIFAPMRCGSGKTLVTLLAPTLLNAQRPLLIVPASLRGKTRREFAVYTRTWRVRLPKILSYEELGREDRDGVIHRYNPDLIMCDEAHRLRTKKNAIPSAMARSVMQAIADHPAAKIAMLSGTLITDRLLDWWPLIIASMGWGAPVTADEREAMLWGQALDRDVGMLRRVDAGALRDIPGGLHEHVRRTFGVISTPGKDCDASIEMKEWAPRLSSNRLDELIDFVRDSKMRPDGELLEDLEIPNVLSQLALGFFFVWDPAPPDWWLLPRRRWLAFVRETLEKMLPGLGSEGRIRNAIDGGDSRVIEGRELRDAWDGIAKAFEPNSVPIWITYEIMDDVTRHVRDGDPCVVWTRYRPVGEELHKRKIPYYPGGTNPDGHKPLQSIACSLQAHSTGQNLQRWHRALVLTLPANAEGWEQLIARFHRTGQTADTILIEVLNSIAYHGEVLGRVDAEARGISRAQGENQKWLDATWI